jgi:hypothetical protein
MAPQGACFDPANNWLIETKTTQILRFDVSTSKLVTPTPTLPVAATGCGHIARDPNTGLFLITGFVQGAGSLLFRYDATSNVITTTYTMNHASASFGGSVAIAGSRHLASLGPAGPGQTIRLRVSSLNEAGRTYVTALSFGFRPGIKIGGRTVFLNPDPLFFTSILGGGIFSNLAGVLDRNGEAFPTIQVPNIPGLSGQRIYAAAITVVPSTINTISHPIVITIQ